MKKSPTLDTSKVTKTLSRLLYRFHIILFVIVVIGGMIVVMFALNQTINRATDTSQILPPAPTSFDQETIDRLNALETNGQQSDIELPSGRINPFSE